MLEEHDNLEEHGKGIKALSMVQHGGGGGGKTVMHPGKALVCLNPKCGGNHYLHDCTKTSDQDKATIFAAAKEKWKAEAAAKKPRSVTPSPMSGRVINIVNAWGRRYQKEEQLKKLNS